MKRIIQTGLVSVALLLASRGAAVAAAPNEVLAKVDGVPITRGELEQHLFSYFGKRSLEEIIDRAALQIEAARLKVVVRDAELDAEMKKLDPGTPGGAKAKSPLLPTPKAARAGIENLMLADRVREKKWPVKDEDLTRLSLRYIRVQSRNVAREILQEAKNGVSFELLAGQRSIDKENLGLVMPDPFLRVEQPYFFKIAWDEYSAGRLRAGSVGTQVLTSQEFFLVLKLERLYPHTGVTGMAREQAIAKVRAYRSAGLAKALRSRYKPEYRVTPDKAIQDGPRDEEVARVGGEDIILHRQELLEHLYGNYGPAALDQLVQRRIIDQAAQKYQVQASAQEAAVSMAETSRKLGAKGFADMLAREGITDAALRERVRYVLLSERVLAKANPPGPDESETMTVQFVRVTSPQQAGQVIQAAKNGLPWQQINRQLTGLAGTENYLQPKRFTRKENPNVFKVLDEKKVAPGQVLGEPVTLGRNMLVLRLESRTKLTELRPTERDEVLRRINAGRLDPFLDGLRGEARIEYVVPPDRLAP